MIILNSEQTKALENAMVEAGGEHIKLMETAGIAVARFIHEKYGVDGQAIAVICGTGNNGGDGFAAAKKLLEGGARVRIILASGTPKTDDAFDLLGRSERAGIKVLDFSKEGEREEIHKTIDASDILVDAVYGTGFHGEIREEIGELFQSINISSATVISVDIPSGVNADTGEAEEHCIKANCTITFTTMKPGHIIFPGAEYCGLVYTSAIGIEPPLVKTENGVLEAIDYQTVRLCFNPRKANTHKGTYGKLLCICGSFNMSGAAVYSAKAAVQSGVGLVKLAAPKSAIPAIASQLCDGVFVPLEENEDGFISERAKRKLSDLLEEDISACLIGCGIGTDSGTASVVRHVIEHSRVPVVIDADALNCIAGDTSVLKRALAPLIITPHPGEMSRLCEADTADIQKRRLASAREFAEKHENVTVVLKGANTIIADKEHTLINLTGNPGMAKGGSGDVLAGIIASFAAQGMSPADAAMCGVYLHGAAGDLASKKFSLHSMTPMDIVLSLPALFLEIER
ncbi:MAG: NAD(P)H-hydrate dehydratase [Oscillospiraceae bacterium]|jgi:NAD(P)H-hydrate epimerase|nr:NAD(P)H-hydrate dehydratase [Oscillospiraceae bacterium]